MLSVARDSGRPTQRDVAGLLAIITAASIVMSRKSMYPVVCASKIARIESTRTHDCWLSARGGGQYDV